MKILLTGATGFIGEAVFSFLKELPDVELHTLSRNPYVNSKNHHCLNLLDINQARCLLENLQASILIHLAWDVSHGIFWTAPNNITYADVTLRLFEAFMENGGKKIIAVGTCAEYLTSSLPVSEEELCDESKLCLYGKEKRRVAAWLQKNSLDFTWLRIFGIFGKDENPKRFFPSMIKAILAQKDFCVKNPDIFTDYIHVLDVGFLISQLIERRGLGILNLGTGQSYALYDWYQGVKKYLNTGIFAIQKTRFPSVDSWIPNCEKLHAQGYRFNFEDNLFSLREMYV